MLPKLYVHIGAHKTGSTYIQKMCAEHEAELLDQGVLYLKAGRKYFGHHQFVDMVRGNVPIEEVRSLVADEVKGGFNSILISSENFEYIQEHEIKRLLSLFDYSECKVIYFFRNWNSMLHSMWQEEVKHGATSNFHMFVSEHIGFPLSSNILNFSLPLRKYAEVVGSKNLTISSYDVVCEGGDIFDYFLSVIGLKTPIEHPCERINAGLEAPVVECIRVLNSIAIARGFKPSILVRQLLLQMFLPAGVPGNLNALFAIMKRYVATSPDYGQCFAARTLFKDFYSEFASSFAHDLEMCRTAIKRPPHSLFVIDPNYLLEPQAREIIYDCWEPIEKALKTDGCLFEGCRGGSEEMK